MSDIDATLVDPDGPVTVICINRPHCRNSADASNA